MPNETPQFLALREPAPAPAPPHRGYSEYPYSPHTAVQELSSGGLHEYVQTLRRRKWLIFSLGVLGLLLGLAAVIPEPLPYPAKTAVEVQGLNESFMRMNEVDPQASSGMYAATPYNILTQARILNSDTLRRRALEKLERETIPSLPPHGMGVAGFLNSIRSALGLNPSEPTKALREALTAASGSAVARAVGDTRIIEIAAESPHPEITAEYLNTLVNEYVDMNLESRSKAAQRTSQWLANQLEEQRTKLEQSETRLREFVGRSGVPGLTQEDTRSTLAQAKLQQLQQELSTIQADRIAKQSRYELAVSKGVEAVPELLAASNLTSQQGALAELQRRKAELLTTLTPAHYKVVRLQAEIGEVESSIQKEKEKILERARTDYEAALRREKLLASAYSGQSGTLLSQSDKALQYTMLRRDVESNRQLYNTMIQQVNQAGVASAVPANNVRVVDAASPAFKPTYRQIYIASALGWVTGLLFGCMLAIVLQQLDRRLRTPAQLQSVSNIPQLGVIPSDFLVERRPALRSRLRRNGAGSPGHPGASLQENRIELVTYQRKPSPMAESFRATLMSILFAVEGRKNAVWSVTSPNPREGKSTVTSNLAIALAELRRRVLVIDADLRKPRLHDIFDVPNTWGISDILQENTRIDQYPADSLARPTTIPNLYVLPSGPAVAVVNTLLYSERLKSLLARLREDFDTVVIDTPPMMLLPDARIIGQMSDAVILVFRAGVSSLADARGASARLIEDGARVLGTVLNDWKPAASSSGYHRHYSYYKSYYSGERT